MSETQIVKAERAQNAEIPCMLIPLRDDTLLVPTVSVAEMASIDVFVPVASMPKWLLGMYFWRGIKVPVVALEVLHGGDLPPINPKGRVAILNNTGVTEGLKFIGILTQNIPRVARIEESDISPDNDREKRHGEIMPVKVGLETFIIPDIAAIERSVSELGLTY